MDIAMCINETCTLKETCLRYNGQASIYQAFTKFEEKEVGKCDYYIKMKNDKNGK